MNGGGSRCGGWGHDDGTTRFNETLRSTRNGRRTAGVTAKGHKDAKTGDYDDGIYHEVAEVSGGCDEGTTVTDGDRQSGSQAECK